MILEWVSSILEPFEVITTASVGFILSMAMSGTKTGGTVPYKAVSWRILKVYPLTQALEYSAGSSNFGSWITDFTKISWYSV